MGKTFQFNGKGFWYSLSCICEDPSKAKDRIFMDVELLLHVNNSKYDS